MRLPTPTNRTIIIAVVAGALIVAVAAMIKKEPAPEAPLPIPTFVPSPAPAAPSKPKDAATSILELFSPSDKALTKQLNEANVRQQIEQLLATSFVLANCKMLSDDDYKRTYKAAIIYAQKSKMAPDQKLASNKIYAIAKAANATYSLLYSRTKCDDPKLPVIKQQLQTWVDAYLPNDPRAAGLEPD